LSDQDLAGLLLASPRPPRFAHRRALLAIEPVDLFQFTATPSRQQQVQPAIAEAPTLGGQFPQPLAQARVVQSARTIAVNPGSMPTSPQA